MASLLSETPRHSTNLIKFKSCFWPLRGKRWQTHLWLLLFFATNCWKTYFFWFVHLLIRYLFLIVTSSILYFLAATTGLSNISLLKTFVDMNNAMSNIHNNFNNAGSQIHDLMIINQANVHSIGDRKSFSIQIVCNCNSGTLFFASVSSFFSYRILSQQHWQPGQWPFDYHSISCSYNLRKRWLSS